MWREWGVLSFERSIRLDGEVMGSTVPGFSALAALYFLAYRLTQAQPNQIDYRTKNSSLS
jgi:hypothetical protein